MKKLLSLLVVMAALVAAGLIIVRSGQKPEERKLAIPFEQMGRVLAHETLRLVPGHGRIAVLRYRVLTDAGNSVLGPAADTFLREIRRDGRLVVAAIESDEYNPFEREEGWARTMMDPPRFADFMAKHGDVDAVVIIGGTPQLGAGDAKKLPAPGPKIITASVLAPPARWLLADGVIASTIISRARPSAERTPPKSPQEWFDRRYEIVTAANAGEKLP
jgi:hypothetical protein